MFGPELGRVVANGVILTVILTALVATGLGFIVGWVLFG